MALRKGDKMNFETLLAAARNGDLALVESRDAKTLEYRALVCAIGRDGDERTISPLAQLNTGDPFEDYVDPTLDELPGPPGWETAGGPTDATL